jgi:NADPH-dependent 2,4-dienoyl-CoA reductase/sulfur reductase-like enzyme
LQAALEHASAGEDVVLVDDQPELGGRSRYTGSDVGTLIERVKAHANVRVLSGCYCFGLYEGNLLGVVQPRPHAKFASG